MWYKVVSAISVFTFFGYTPSYLEERRLHIFLKDASSEISRISRKVSDIFYVQITILFTKTNSFIQEFHYMANNNKKIVAIDLYFLPSSEHAHNMDKNLTIIY